MSVTPFDAAAPQPERWSFVPPTRGTRAPLSLKLDRAITASAEHLIAVRGPDGQRVPGRARLQDGETLWLFQPSRPWAAGRHVIVTHPDLETPAGNRICAAFETGPEGHAGCGKATELRFDVAR